MTPQQPEAPDPSRAGPATPPDGDAELPALLAEHCRRIDARAGAALRVGPDGRVDILGVWPESQPQAEPPAWLHAAVSSAGEVAAARRPKVIPLHEPGRMYTDSAAAHLAMVPFGGGRPAGVAAFVADGADGSDLADRAAGVRFQVDALSLYAGRLGGPSMKLQSAEMAAAMSVLAAVNDHARLLPAGMALCNEVAARWDCDRVSLGFARGRYVRLAATSHTEKVSRKMQAVQRIEAAMEECFDQDLEVRFPADGQAEFVWRSAGELSSSAAGACVLSLPLRRNGQVVAVVTAERPADRPFSGRDVEGLRLTCDLCSARLGDLHERGRWVGARMAAGARKALGALIGPRHTWAKLAVAAGVALAAFLAFARGDYHVRAPFVLQATQQQVVGAPFEGQIEAVLVEVGQRVREGQILARMRNIELKRELNGLLAERFEARKQADAARAAKSWAQAKIAEARQRQLDEQIAHRRERIEAAALRARFSGTVVKGDLERHQGAAVTKAQPLLEVARIETLRAELSVPEDQVADLLSAMAHGDVRGQLATTSHVDRKIPFVVRRVDPMAAEADGATVFKVRADLIGAGAGELAWMRPGMAGVARIPLGRRRYAWIWTRRLSNWLRLRLWM